MTPMVRDAEAIRGQTALAWEVNQPVPGASLLFRLEPQESSDSSAAALLTEANTVSLV